MKENLELLVNKINQAKKELEEVKRIVVSENLKFKELLEEVEEKSCEYGMAKTKRLLEWLKNSAPTVREIEETNDEYRIHNLEKEISERIGEVTKDKGIELPLEGELDIKIVKKEFNLKKAAFGEKIRFFLDTSYKVGILETIYKLKEDGTEIREDECNKALETALRIGIGEVKLASIIKFAINTEFSIIPYELTKEITILNIRDISKLISTFAVLIRYGADPFLGDDYAMNIMESRFVGSELLDLFLMAGNGHKGKELDVKDKYNVSIWSYIADTAIVGKFEMYTYLYAHGAEYNREKSLFWRAYDWWLNNAGLAPRINEDELRAIEAAGKLYVEMKEVDKKIIQQMIQELVTITQTREEGKSLVLSSELPEEINQLILKEYAQSYSKEGAGFIRENNIKFIYDQACEFHKKLNEIRVGWSTGPLPKTQENYKAYIVHSVGEAQKEIGAEIADYYMSFSECKHRFEYMLGKERECNIAEDSIGRMSIL